MSLFPQQFIDDLRLQANIVQVVQEYVPLKRAGTTYKGLCPFHSEKTPSFSVNPDKGFFYCFGCGLGGDVFKFLELHEKVGFRITRLAPESLKGRYFGALLLVSSLLLIPASAILADWVTSRIMISWR